MMKTVNIKEATFGKSSDVKYDIVKGEMYDVLIWGNNSRNSRTYPAQVLREATKLADDAIVFVDHTSDRDKADRTRMPEGFGVIREAYIDPQGEMRAKKFSWNIQHEFHKNFAWWLENAPDKIGFSVDGKADLDRSPLSRVMEATKIRSIDSFDIVFNPATTRSILESTNNMEPTLDDHFGQLAAKIVSDASMDIATKKSKLMQLLKMLDDKEGTQSTVDASAEATSDAAGEDAAIQEATKFNRNPLVKKLLTIINTHQTENVKLRESVSQSEHEKMKAVRITEAKKYLSDEALSSVFTGALFNAKDDAAVKAIIDEQVKLVETIGGKKKQPVSSGTDVVVRESTNGTQTKEKYDKEKIKKLAEEMHS
jgi:hypothetical protein